MKVSRSLLPAALLATALATAGCGDDENVTYAYFNVAVRFDPATMPVPLMQQVFTCGIIVEGPKQDSANLPCRRGDMTFDIGTFNYSTNVPRMSYRFTVVAYDINRRELARGTSEPRGALPNMTVDASVLVQGLPGPLAEIRGEMP
jgi:hypothetical protein